MLKRIAFPLTLLSLVLLVAACSQSAPAPAPTAAPAKAAEPTKAAAPAAAPTTAPAAAPAATKAPAPAPTAAPAAKVDFPTKPISIIIAFAAGGSSDVGARVLTPILEKDLGQPVQVVNRAGAGGQIGWTELALAKPDGYTIAGINLPHLPAVIVDPERQAAFKQADIDPFVTQAVDPTTISVRANEKYKTLKDLVDDAKARPGQITAGIVGILNDDEIGYLQFADAAGIEFRAVRFDGAATAITALLGGHVDVLFCTVGDIFVQTKAGKILNLAVMEKERITKFFPDIPTMKELGYGEMLSSSTRGFALPKGVPQPIIDKLEAAFIKAEKSPEHMTKIEEAGQPVVIEGRQVFTKWYNDSNETIKKWIGKRIKDQ